MNPNEIRARLRPLCAFDFCRMTRHSGCSAAALGLFVSLAVGRVGLSGEPTEPNEARAAAETRIPFATPADAPASAPASPPLDPPSVDPPAATPTDPSAASPSASSDAAAQPPGPNVTLVTGERLVGALGPLQQGRLTVGADPPRQVALADIERIELSPRPGLVVVWVGQDNSDLAQGSAELGANRIQDIHLRIQGLPPDKEISQLSVICRPASVLQRLIRPQIHEWRLTQPTATDWKLSLSREESGRAAGADVYFEPIATDAFENDFLVSVTYGDGANDKASVKAATHTNHQLAVGQPTAAAPPPTAAPPPAAGSPSQARLLLDGQDRLTGEIKAMDDRQLVLAWSAPAEISLPLLEIRAIRWSGVTSAEADARFAAALAQPGEDDVAIALGPDGAIVPIRGSVQDLADGKLRLRYEGEVRSINLARLAGVVFARRPTTRSKTSPVQVVQFATGDQISGGLTALTDEVIELELPWKATFRFARQAASGILFRNGSIVYLSDLEPTAVEEMPFFGRKLSYRRDVSLAGGPLRIHGQDHRKGLAVHSRSVLTYRLDGEFERLASTIGFDESGRRRGRVACSIVVDGEVRFHSESVRADEYPTSINLSVAGAQELQLVVDFGEYEDIGDRVIWGSARLLRAASSGGLNID